MSIEEINALKNNLATSFAGFSVTGKALFAKEFNAVNWLINSGSIESAKKAVELVQIPSAVPGVDAQELARWADIKTEILALF